MYCSQPEALELHFSQLVPVGSENVYLSDTRIYRTLKNLSIDNECKCQILPLLKPRFQCDFGNKSIIVESFVSISREHILYQSWKRGIGKHR